ncbi:tyrosine-type recombinase/integrase [Modestobacter roseus]|uniref:tyrosine-type recombinase/integrase n=1 Tax=Modestobacter roseus TaxID=1181884 RepID=UPI0012958365|nr:tyrosine-type recombinase/integrase [Modestobacter roseus]MQA35959.1 tyrosine-type recombinase/integrase [Modestobacter roseus]
MSNIGRPRTERGQWGKITLTPLVERDGKWVAAPEGAKPGRWRARARYRDENGRVHPVQREATAKARAERTLRDALHNWTTPVQGAAFSADLTLRDAGQLWLEQKRRPESGVKASSLSQYEANFGRYVRDSTIAERTLRDVNAVPILRPFLQKVADDHGSGAARTARTVVSGILTMAMEDGVLTHNAARNVRPPKPVTGVKDRMSERRRAVVGDGPDVVRNTKRALTRQERDALLAFAAQDEASQRRDVVDLVRWMAGTGVRISEALDQSWDDIDLATGRARVRGTKSEHSNRLAELPAWLVECLRERRAGGVSASGYVFDSPRTGGRRDRRNAARAVRDLLDRAGFAWMTPHTFRRTVATLIVEAGLPINMAADVLGHADASMTARLYLGRNTDTARAAAVL